MKFTVGELLDIGGNLNKLTLIKEIPAITGYKIATLVRKLSGPISDVTKAKHNLIKKYSDSPDEKNMITVLPENMSKFITELNELVMEEIEVDIKEVKLPEDVKLPDASALIGLDRFITV